MNRSLRNFLVLSSLLTLGSESWAETPSPPRNPEIQVRIHDYAQVPSATLNRAEKEASRVLREAGIDATFLHCSVSSGQSHEDAACERQLRPTDLVVSILSRSMARKVPLSGTTFGFARQSDRGGHAYVASVFSHRVEELAKHGVASRAVILGHVLAHEIGHLLLGEGHHSRTGIMRGSWPNKVLKKAAEGNMLFTKAQAKRLQGQTHARVRASRD